MVDACYKAISKLTGTGAARPLRREGDHRRHRRPGRGVRAWFEDGAPRDRPGRPHRHHLGQRAAYVNALNKLEQRHQRRRAPSSRGESDDAAARSLVLPGDGIGPEVTAEARRRPRRSRRGVDCTRVEALIGGGAIDARRHAALPTRPSRCAQAATRCCSARSAARSGTTRARTVRPEQACCACARSLGLFANLRPAAVLPGAARRRAR